MIASTPNGCRSRRPAAASRDGAQTPSRQDITTAAPLLAPAGFEPAFRHRVQQQSPRMHGLVAPWTGLPRRPRFRLMALPQKLCHVAVSNHAPGRGEPVAHHDPPRSRRPVAAAGTASGQVVADDLRAAEPVAAIAEVQCRVLVRTVISGQLDGGPASLTPEPARTWPGGPSPLVATPPALRVGVATRAGGPAARPGR